MIWRVAGLRPNFFSSGRIFLAELAQESWRDLAAVCRTEASPDISKLKHCPTLQNWGPIQHCGTSSPFPNLRGGGVEYFTRKLRGSVLYNYRLYDSLLSHDLKNATQRVTGGHTHSLYWQGKICMDWKETQNKEPEKCEFKGCKNKNYFLKKVRMRWCAADFSFAQLAKGKKSRP